MWSPLFGLLFFFHFFSQERKEMERYPSDSEDKKPPTGEKIFIYKTPLLLYNTICYQK